MIVTPVVKSAWLCQYSSDPENKIKYRDKHKHSKCKSFIHKMVADQKQKRDDDQRARRTEQQDQKAIK